MIKSVVITGIIGMTICSGFYTEQKVKNRLQPNILLHSANNINSPIEAGEEKIVYFVPYLIVETK